LGEKTLLDFNEEAKGDAATERGIRDHKIGEAAGGGGGGVFGGGVGDVVDEALVVGVGKFLGFRVVDFGKDEGGETGCLGGGRGGVFGEDCDVMRDAGIEERSWSLLAERSWGC